MKRPGKNSIMRDTIKRKALLRWLKSNTGKRDSDGRVGLILCLAWDAGYESARRRFASSGPQP